MTYGIMAGNRSYQLLPPNHDEHTRLAMTVPMLTQDYLKSILHYNPDTGFFTWLYRTDFKSLRSQNMWNSKYVGRRAGSNQGRYINIDIHAKAFRAHRLAFLYMTGELPTDYVDHINGVSLDNRWCNLRHVTHAENMRNQRKRTNSTSDCMGVHWAKKARKWVACIYTDKGRIHLGSFDQQDAAVSARKAAEINYGYHANHGRAV